ncbi:hypothetical protein A2767_04705 [Candidatus Roizmanbacteria bacterium RIFCSPHIGHO2_01_FULL_35_10]|uniref:Uncharacterized protein n=1 Tax=Candidatus Roizmanbacteria bacterium RIFCSPLOWO2_01_FULL_35_13 TaxID=1802055 RepID=A0A1F7I720_9BACT|nr:MAG: hypothetical protein A2767_04705 [Candidatus Roizmanbacteria bacterium RIFCSPHIGHO2_01_FULL_35_10]OGK39151.1 MAG: hypothetical protein A3A74_03590 [Candidatus Roizmanbacteria bacterium RIFCSPLOWO2_01_FULL_35_13]
MNHKELFWISLTIFLTIVLWMIMDIYRARTQITVESELKSLETVNYTVNPDILNVLGEKNP